MRGASLFGLAPFVFGLMSSEDGKRPSPFAILRRLIPLVIIGALVAVGVFADKAREAKRSQLSGVFETLPTYASSRIAGRVASIEVQEGASADAGQVLIRLEVEPQSHDAEAAEAAVEQAAATVGDLEAGPRASEIIRQEAQVAELRATLSKLINGPRPEDVRAAQLAADAAEARAAQVKKGPKQEDIEAAKAAERAAQAALDQAERGPTKEEVKSLEAQYQSAQVKADDARARAKRLKVLWKEGAVSEQDFKTADAAADSLEQSAEALRQTWLRAKRGTPEPELELARQSLARATAQRESLESGATREEIRAAELEARSARQSAESLARGSRPEDIAAARARVAQAEAALKTLREGAREGEIAQAKAAEKASAAKAASARDLEDEGAVTSTISGVVNHILVAVGDLVQPGQPLVQISGEDDIWIRVYVPEEHLAKLKAGDAAELRVDGIDEVLAGKVEAISETGEFTPVNLQTPEERGRQVFGVKIRLAKPDDRVKAGMAATVTKLGDWP